LIAFRRAVIHGAEGKLDLLAWRNLSGFVSYSYVRPSLSVDVSVGADVYTSERLRVKLQTDGENPTDRLNVIDFGGLFSGNAIDPARSFALRLTTNF
jgi:hypothetical protein